MLHENRRGRRGIVRIAIVEGDAEDRPPAASFGERGG